jgi:hypothetical protein
MRFNFNLQSIKLAMVQTDILSPLQITAGTVRTTYHHSKSQLALFALHGLVFKSPQIY